MEFAKATLQAVSSTPSDPPKTTGDPMKVQVNPASLRLQMANNVDMGKAFARPNTQYQGSSSSTLSFDLVFDTADEGTTDAPLDVRTRTSALEKFLLPDTTSPKSVPPRVQFTYGTLTVVGVMSALNQEFDFFAVNGTPLRAKCAVTIKEQKPEFDAKKVGPGANTGAGATPPVPPGAGGGGTAPPPPADRTGTALAGESASDFANRMGLDPSAWKGLAGALADPLRLEAGLQIDFSASLSIDVGLGLGVSAVAGIGIAGGSGSSVSAASGAGPIGRAEIPARAVPAQPPADGAALTAQGGLSRAMDRAAAANAGAAAGATRVAFSADPVSAAPSPAARAVTSASLDPVVSSAGAAPPSAAAAVVTVDPRSTSFGFGVPLRPRSGVASPIVTGLVHERRRHAATASDQFVPITDDPTVPRWRALPLVDDESGTAGPPSSSRRRAPHRSASGCGCGCGGGGR